MLETTELISKLNEDRGRMINYIRHKIEKQDWHGVADAAMDLREIDAKIEQLKELK